MGQGPGRPFPTLAHRLIWSILIGPPAPHLHHECRIRLCVFPGHLTPMDPSAHKLLHVAETERTHCVNGHEFTGANTYWRSDKAGRKSRQCRACKAAVSRRAWATMTDVERADAIADRTARRRTARRSQPERNVGSTVTGRGTPTQPTPLHAG